MFFPKLAPPTHLLWLAALLIALGYLLGASLLMWFGYFCAAMLLMALLWQKLAWRGVEFERQFSETRAFVGEEVKLSWVIRNKKFLPLPWLRLTDSFSEGLTFADLEVGTSHIPGMAATQQHFSLGWHDQARRSYTIVCQKRGFYTFNYAELTTTDPLGLYRQLRRHEQAARLIIYPSLKPVLGLDLPTKEPFGEKVVQQRIFQDPILMRNIRDYQPEDDLRYVHWKASAKTDRLKTKVFEPTNSPNLALFINVATFEKRWRGIDPDLLERIVSVSASVCAHAVEQRLLVGLSANGTFLRSDQPLRVLPGRSPQQLTRLLEALAGIRGFATTDFPHFLLHDSSRFPWGATLMIVTAVVPPELEAVLLRLRRAGRKLVLLSLAETPPVWRQGIVSYHLPGRQADSEFVFEPIWPAPSVG